jgi:hypothetical protein
MGMNLPNFSVNPVLPKRRQEHTPPKKENYRSITLINVDAKIFNEYLQIEFNSTLRPYTTIK